MPQTQKRFFDAYARPTLIRRSDVELNTRYDKEPASGGLEGKGGGGGKDRAGILNGPDLSLVCAQLVLAFGEEEDCRCYVMVRNNFHALPRISDEGGTR